MTFSEELISLLEQELKALNMLLDISNSKTDIIIKNDVEKLGEVVPREEELIKAVITLEKQRMELLDTWGVAVDTPITNIIEDVVEGKEELSRLRDELFQVMEDLGNRNELNNSIMQENMDWLEFNINLITSTEAPVGYDEDNKEKSSGDRSMFDTKA